MGEIFNGTLAKYIYIQIPFSDVSASTLLFWNRNNVYANVYIVYKIIKSIKNGKKMINNKPLDFNDFFS